MKANSWTVTHDPIRLLDDKTNLAQLENEAREQGEDIIQATCGCMTLDLGWYRDRYQVLLVKDQNWTAPVKQAEASDLVSALRRFRNLLV
jgi:hypothetical protein